MGLIKSVLRRELRKAGIKNRRHAPPAGAEDLLPGETRIRDVVTFGRRRWRKPPGKKSDAGAAVTIALNEIPDGMACGLLAGVSPVVGLFAAVFGCIAGGLFNSTRLMIVTTTSASAFLLFHLTRQFDPDQRLEALAWLVLLSGGMMMVMGWLKFGELVRFVSYSVMTGVLAGISVMAILSQLPLLFGIAVSDHNKLVQTAELAQEIENVNWRALIPGLSTIACMIFLPRTFVGSRSAIFAIALPSLLVNFANWDDIQVVADAGEIPTEMPSLRWPDIGLLQPSLFTGALSLAIVTLIQAAGVSQSVPNPDGTRSDTSRDFVSQGIANVTSGLFGGSGVGGSIGSTALNIVSGARSRWAGIFGGWLVLALVLLLPDLVMAVTMPALAGLMIFAMANALRIGEVAQVWRAGWASRIALVTAFVVTLFVSVQFAILVGVILSFTVYFYTSSGVVRLQAIRLRDDGRVEEIEQAEFNGTDQLQVFAIEGDLHFAGARVLADQWPAVKKSAERPVVVLEMRGRHRIGATFTEVLGRYHDRIRKAGGRIYLTELDDDDLQSLEPRAKSDILKGIRLVPKTRIVGESTWASVRDAESWLKS